ncbi:hypothetical protein [Vibrio owensii]|uniref:hypothetical protein n=1 Tax=Vibrio owensii TaxID=696485 RepID=UPI0018F1E855|nr:hypothetical protein [Vibrio owensii]
MGKDKMAYDESETMPGSEATSSEQFESVHQEYVADSEVDDGLEDFGQRSGSGAFSVVSVLKGAVVIYAAAAATFGVYHAYQNGLDAVNASEIAELATVEDVNRLSMDVRLLRNELTDINIESRLDELEVRAGDASSRLSVVDGLTDRMSSFESRIGELGGRVSTLGVDFDGLDFVTPVQYSQVSKKIFELQGQIDDLAGASQSGGVFVEDLSVVPEVVDVVVEPEYEVRYSIGPLHVERFVRYTERYLLVMGDGISGTVQLAEGNRVGRYVIESVSSDSALVLDTISDERFELKVK